MEWSEDGREAAGDGGALEERIGRNVIGDDGVKSEGKWGGEEGAGAKNERAAQLHGTAVDTMCKKIANIYGMEVAWSSSHSVIVGQEMRI